MVKNSVRFPLALSGPPRVAAPYTVDATFAATTGDQYIEPGWAKVHAPGMQSDQNIIAAGVMTRMNDRSAQAVEFGTPIDHGTDETRSFNISPSSNDMRQIFWPLHLSQPQ